MGRWLDWLTRFVPEPVKRPIKNAFKKIVMSLFPKELKFEESKKSALKWFAKEHTIKRQIKPLTPRRF